MFNHLLFSILLFISFTSLTANELPKLNYYTEDAPPFNWKKDGQIKGIAADLLRLMWKEMNMPPQTIKLVPWARGYHILEKSPTAVLFSTSRTEDREKLFKWVCPIRETRYSLVARKIHKIKIKNIGEAKKYNIGTVRNDVAEQLLKKAGFPKRLINPVSNMKQNVRKMMSGRVDVITFNEESIFQIIKEMNLDPNEFEVVYIIKKTPVCYAFNIQVSDKIITRFQNALNTIIKRPIYNNLQKKYFK